MSDHPTLLLDLGIAVVIMLLLFLGATSVFVLGITLWAESDSYIFGIAPLASSLLFLLCGLFFIGWQAALFHVVPWPTAQHPTPKSALWWLVPFVQFKKPFDDLNTAWVASTGAPMGKLSIVHYWQGGLILAGALFIAREFIFSENQDIVVLVSAAAWLLLVVTALLCVVMVWKLTNANKRQSTVQDDQ